MKGNPALLAALRLEAGDGISLEPLKPGDAQELFALVDASRRHLRRWLPWVDATRSPRDSRKFILFARRQLAAGSGAHLAIRQGDAIVGVIGSVSIDWKRRMMEVGYWLGADYAGRGIATASCRAFVGAAFSKLRLNRVEIRAARENAKSRAVPERLGFRKEGELRETHPLNGRLHDLIVYGMLRREWKRTGHVTSRPPASP